MCVRPTGGHGYWTNGNIINWDLLSWLIQRETKAIAKTSGKENRERQ